MPRSSRLSSCELAALALPAHPAALGSRSTAGGGGTGGTAGHLHCASRSDDSDPRSGVRRAAAVRDRRRRSRRRHRASRTTTQSRCRRSGSRWHASRAARCAAAVAPRCRSGPAARRASGVPRGCRRSRRVAAGTRAGIRRTSSRLTIDNRRLGQRKQLHAESSSTAASAGVAGKPPRNASVSRRRRSRPRRCHRRLASGCARMKRRRRCRRRGKAGSCLEIRPAVVDQEIADVGRAFIGVRRCAGRRLHESQSEPATSTSVRPDPFASSSIACR